MESGTNKKMKVVWICHFSNQKIRDILPLSSMKTSNLIRGVLGKKKFFYSDFAPWITNQIAEFKKFKNVELHLIVPHVGLKPFNFEFELDGIYYHFFKPELPLHLDILLNKLGFHKKRKFRLNRLWVRNFIIKIQPDIINLIGTENPYYSITVLDIKNVPIYVSAQTVYTNPDRKKYSDSCIDLNWEVELKIHKKEKYFGCSGRMHRDLIINNNADANIFKYFFPVQKPPQVKSVSKDYDFVYFAQHVSAKKGIVDAIDALYIVSKEKQDITLNIVGNCTLNYKIFLEKKIELLGLKDNIHFTGFFPVHVDMYQHLKKSKFALLPIKMDVISSTIIEAALLHLPIVTYKTSGTPYLNREDECLLISEIGDVAGLALNMIKLLNDKVYAKKLADNAMEYVTRVWDNKRSSEKLLSDYKAVIDHYHNNKTIPKELLFDLNEFPIY